MGNRISRREILKVSACATLARPLGAVAGSFESMQHNTLVPADKKLDPEWVKSLTSRGEEPWISDIKALNNIGMPVGGLFAGCVYLAGDGRLWNWDIFNHYQVGCVERPDGVEYEGRKLNVLEGANYVDPVQPNGPFAFSVKLEADKSRQMDASGWGSVRFLGQYPVGTVEYSDSATPVNVKLEAFSPFIPHDVERSSFPATIMHYTIANKSSNGVNVRLIVSCEHPGLALDGRGMKARLGTEFIEAPGATFVDFGLSKIERKKSNRPEIVFEDWEHGTYKGWKATGTAFGDRPRHKSDIIDYQGDLGIHGEWVVNTHNTRAKERVTQADFHVGKLTSDVFTVSRSYINFLIGGGKHPGKTCLNLLIGDAIVRTTTGHDGNQMRSEFFDVREFAGKQARLQIVDDETSGWGNIGIDNIVFSDDIVEEDVEARGDYGTFCMAILSDGSRESAVESKASLRPSATTTVLEKIPANSSKVVTVVLAWNFPNLNLPGFNKQKRWYASKWPSALDVAKNVVKELTELSRLTFLWRDTWYDSTLPYWLLDRTFANLSTLATNTCYRFEDGRFWFWEGVGCCAGTCTHVWSYAQGIAHVFPEIEAYLREKIDFGEYFHEDTGAIDYRGEFARSVAHDGQCGCIMRAYREHTMQRDTRFLLAIYPNVKKAMQHIISEDVGRDGILEGSQYNTLDAAWFGPMSWVSSMYLGALRASEAMANEVGDKEFANECAKIIKTGSKNLTSTLFNGEYFVHVPDPTHPEANATGKGCHIDQLYGQSWCHWMGLERIVSAQESKTAMANLYKYNFAPDVGPYRRGMKIVQGGRWYAMPGEGGLIMTTFPKGGADRATGAGRDAWAAMYFNECMSGFEYQAAAHMIAEGLVTEGLAVTRAIHDRYSPSKRNPYNEVECSDHYGRALASFGVFWNLCGYRVHGPRKEFTSSPMIQGALKAAFIDARGWGTCVNGTREYRYRNDE